MAAADGDNRMIEIRPQASVLGAVEASKVIGLDSVTLRRAAWDGLVPCVVAGDGARFEVQSVAEAAQEARGGSPGELVAAGTSAVRRLESMRDSAAQDTPAIPPQRPLNPSSADLQRFDHELADVRSKWNHDTLRLVYYAIRVSGLEGITDDAIAASLGKLPQSVGPRRLELTEKGLVMDTDRKRLTRSGKLARVRVAKASIDEAKAAGGAL